jgi:hypothetical protein
MAACYNGPNPADEDPRLRPTIWKWTKENAIDKGLDLSQTKDAINNHFFAGQAKDKWLNDIIGGRKTPFRSVANAAWKAQFNRRQIIKQAQNLSKTQAMGPIGRAAAFAGDIPRELATIGHAVVFPISHAGDLLINPLRWGTVFRGIFNTYRSGWYGKGSQIFHDQMMKDLKKKSLYDLGLRSSVDISEKSHATGLISRIFGKSSERAWDALKVMRYELWEQRMNKYLKPDMTQEQQLELGKEMANWANHATGSVKTVPTIGGLMFGPKLTASKLARLGADPWDTIKTFANWNNATYGQKAVAWTRLAGATQYGVGLAGFLAVNQGFLWATHSNQKVNWSDPDKPDFLAFKGFGMEGYIPGLHTEIRTLAQILATARLNPRTPGLANWQKQDAKDKFGAIAKIGGQYLMHKATPGLEETLELATGQDYQGRPLPALPWVNQPGTAKKPKYDWTEYALTHAPIPLTGPVGYFYKKLREGGTSSLDATAITRALIIFGIGMTGTHIAEDKPNQNMDEAAQVAKAKHILLGY